MQTNKLSNAKTTGKTRTLRVTIVYKHNTPLCDRSKMLDRVHNALMHSEDFSNFEIEVGDKSEFCSSGSEMMIHIINGDRNKVAKIVNRVLAQRLYV